MAYFATCQTLEQLKKEHIRKPSPPGTLKGDSMPHFIPHFFPRRRDAKHYARETEKPQTRL